MKQNEVLIVGGVVIAIGAIYFLSNKKDNYIQEPVLQPGAETNPVVNPVSTPAFTGPNKNLLLQKGSKGIEVYELQKLLKITPDGAFGSQTESALFNKKAVKKITLNDYSKIKDVLATTLKVGDIVKPSSIMGVIGTKVYENVTNNGQYTNTKKHIDTYHNGEYIGKIISITSDKTYSVILGNHPLTGKDQILWALTSEIQKV